MPDIVEVLNTFVEENFRTHSFYTTQDELPADFPKEYGSAKGMLVPVCKECGAVGRETGLFPCADFKAFTDSQKYTVRSNLVAASNERLHTFIDVITQLTAIANQILQKGYSAVPNNAKVTYGALLEVELARLEIVLSVMAINSDTGQERIANYIKPAAEEFNATMKFNSFPMEYVEEQEEPTAPATPQDDNFGIV